MKKAFSYMFQDSLFGKKAVIYFVLTLFITFLNLLVNLYSELNPNSYFPVYIYVYAFFGIFVSFLLDGYFIACIQKFTEDMENPVIPFINFKRDMKKGLKLLVAKVLAFIVYGAIFFGMVTLFYFIHVSGLKILADILAHLWILALIAFLSVYSLSFVNLFVKTESLKSLINFPKATKFIKEHAKEYFKTLGILVLLVVAVFILNFVFMTLFMFLIGNNALTSFIMALFISLVTIYLMYVSAHIIANFIKEK